jgi:hypothetical protein
MAYNVTNGYYKVGAFYWYLNTHYANAGSKLVLVNNSNKVTISANNTGDAVNITLLDGVPYVLFNNATVITGTSQLKAQDLNADSNTVFYINNWTTLNPSAIL